MSKHKLGPWCLNDKSPMIIEDKFNGPWCLSDESPMIIEDKYKDIVGSASTYPHSGHFPREKQAEANARLIAAAPELLEALEALQPYVLHLPDGAPIKETIRAAIAKAKGDGV